MTYSWDSDLVVCQTHATDGRPTCLRGGGGGVRAVSQVVVLGAPTGAGRGARLPAGAHGFT